MPEVLITNAVMTNNGDAALVTTLASEIRRRGHRVSIATHNLAFATEHYPEWQFHQDVVGSRLLGPRRIFARAAIPVLVRFSQAYHAADIVIGAPGGYINSYYGFQWKALALRTSRQQGKRVALYAQSLGPLNDLDRERLRSLGGAIDIVMPRDEESERMASTCGIPSSRIRRTPDAIFLRMPHHDTARKSSGPVLISVREWTHDGVDVGEYVAAMQAIVMDIVGRGYAVQFVSTCQGVSGYVDDSVMAKRIVGGLRLRPHDRVSVEARWLSLSELDERIEAAPFVVGTRLHMCLLSLLRGVPAFNISYEAKGRECYAYLGISDLSVEYGAAPAGVAAKFKQFVTEGRMRMDDTWAQIRVLHNAAQSDLDQVLGELSR